MIALDRLRPPGPFDPRAVAYKDWLHLNAFHHASGSVCLVNVSLHGHPEDPRSRAVGAALAHVPGGAWRGNLSVRGLGDARLGPASIGLPEVGLAVHHDSGTVTAVAQLPDDALALRVTARATSRAWVVEERLPLGSGWLSWYVVPRLALAGSLVVDGTRHDLAGAVAYHDHNWGRWHWGDDLGWDWGTFAAADGTVLVVARTTDRGHLRPGALTLLVQSGDRSRRFAGAGVQLDAHGRFAERLRRLPGAMAALHTDRARPHLPAEITLRARDGDHHATVRFRARAAAQLITADPVRRGYGFIHELVGGFEYEARLGGADLGGKGLGVVEYVD